MAIESSYGNSGRLKIVKFSRGDLIVQCSAINKSNNSDTDSKGWARAGNTENERIVASDTSDNWRMCIRINKDELKKRIKGPVVGVKLEVNPIQGKTCQPYNTQAVLTDKLYSAATNNLIDTKWCSQGKIYDSTGNYRSGDIGIDLKNKGAKSVFGGGHMVTAQRACTGSDNAGYSIATYKGSSPGTLCYLFSDSAAEPSSKWGDASVNKSRIAYSQVNHQTLKNMFDRVIDSDNDDDQVCFYLTRYKNLEKSSYGYGGWIYSDAITSWSVYVVYVDQVSVKIPLYINGHNASNDSLVTDYLLTNKYGGPYVKIVVHEDDTTHTVLPSYNPSTTYKLTYGSRIAVSINGTMAKNNLIVSSDSEVSEAPRDVTSEMDLKLNLRTGVTFIDPYLQSDIQPKYCEYKSIDGYYGDDPVPLPITPGREKLKGSCAPSAIYYTCDKLEDEDGSSVIANTFGSSYPIPDVYDSWKSNPTLSTYTNVTRDISDVTYRKYKCEFVLRLPDRTVLRREETDQTFTLKPDEIGGFPKVVSQFMNNMSKEYPGIEVVYLLTSVGGDSVESWRPNWDNILRCASEVVNLESDDPIEIVVEAELVFHSPITYCFYKGEDNNLYRAIYYDGEDAYQAVIQNDATGLD